MAIYDYSPTKVELQSLIQFFSGGRCNVTLGGVYYIHLTMGADDITDSSTSLLFSRNFVNTERNGQPFKKDATYLYEQKKVKKRLPPFLSGQNVI